MNILPNTSKSLLLGNKGQHLSYSAFKLAVLTGQLSLLSFLINASYILFDLYHEVYYSWPLLSVSAVLSLTSFGLNKLGYHFAAKLFLGLTTNLTIFVFSSLEPVETGLSFLFVICALGAISTLGFEQKKLAILFVSLPVVLFIFSVVIDLGFFTRPPYTPDYVRINMIINFLATFAAAVLIIYFLLRLNNHSESALRENEKRLNNKNEELIKVNKELDRFVYSASHDLRSPISSVRGLISLVKLNPNSPDAKSYLDMMDTQLIGLNKFIEDIVVYSRNSRVAVKTDLIQLKKLVDEILNGLQFYPGSEKIKIHVNIPEDLTVRSDTTRVRIVLANLLSNAFKYSNPTKENAFIKIGYTKNQTHLEISIQDNGTGIDQQYLTKIFDMFFQANDNAVGSGLGLYIVKETLEKIQGDIRVQSEVGKGTEFIVTLPIEIDETLLRV
jgi:signal transduction histidine kinase